MCLKTRVRTGGSCENGSPTSSTVEKLRSDQRCWHFNFNFCQLFFVVGKLQRGRHRSAVMAVVIRDFFLGQYGAQWAQYGLFHNATSTVERHTYGQSRKKNMNRLFLDPFTVWRNSAFPRFHGNTLVVIVSRRLLIWEMSVKCIEISSSQSPSQPSQQPVSYMQNILSNGVSCSGVPIIPNAVLLNSAQVEIFRACSVSIPRNPLASTLMCNPSSPALSKCVTTGKYRVQA